MQAIIEAFGFTTFGAERGSIVFITWRKRPVRDDRRVAFLLDDLGNSDCATPWKPLHCEHRGSGRLAWTALLMHARRVDGRPRQELLHRFPTIRSCCIADSFARAAWWHDVGGTIGGWGEGYFGEPSLYIARDRPAILAKLRDVVPPPTRGGVVAFTAYREPVEEVHRRFWDSMRDEQVDAARRRRDERGRARSSDGDGGDGFATLGLGPAATLEDVKRRYRELAKEHHPDRGGDARQFARYTEAYRRACATFGR